MMIYSPKNEQMEHQEQPLWIKKVLAEVIREQVTKVFFFRGKIGSLFTVYIPRLERLPIFLAVL